MPIIAPSYRWPLRGVTADLDDLERVRRVLAEGYGEDRIPHLSAEDARGEGLVAAEVQDLARANVARFRVSAPGAELEWDRVSRAAWIDVREPAEALALYGVLRERRSRRWLPVWRPYDAVFVPLTKVEAGHQHDRRVALVAATAGVLALIVAVVALV